MVSVGHFVEQLAGVAHVTAFAIYVNKGVGERFALGYAGFDELGVEFLDGGIRGLASGAELELVKILRD